MAPTFISGVAILLSAVFPDIDIAAFNTTLNTLVAVALSAFIMYRQWATGRATPFGARPKD